MKSKKTSQTYTAAYKAQAVKMALETNSTLNEVTKWLNMPMQTLASWVQHVKADKLPKLPTYVYQHSFSSIEQAQIFWLITTTVNASIQLSVINPL